MGTWGARLNPSHYTETDAVDVGVLATGALTTDLTSAVSTLVLAPRPGDAAPDLLVRDAQTLTALPSWPQPADGLLDDYTVADPLVLAIQVSGDGGTTWSGSLLSEESVVASLTTTTDTAALAAAAAAAAESSAGSRTAADLAAAAAEASRVALTASEATWNTWLVLNPGGTREAFLASQEGPPGPAGTGGGVTQEFTLNTTISAGHWVPVDAATDPFGKNLSRVAFNTDEPAGGVFNLEMKTSDGGTASDLITNLTIPGAQTKIVQSYTLGTKILPAGCFYRCKVVTAPTLGVGAAAVDPLIVASTAYSSGSNTNSPPSTPHTLTMPSGGAAGDKVYVFVPETANNTVLQMNGAGWSRTISKPSITPGTAQLAGVVFTADWTSSLNMDVHVKDVALANASRALAAVVLLIRNVPAGSMANGLNSPGNTTGGTYAGDALVLPGTGPFLALQVEFYRQKDIASTLTPSGGPSGQTAVNNAVTSRHTIALNPDTGVIVRSAGVRAASFNLGSVTWTTTKDSGIGVLTDMTHVAGWIGIPGATGSAGGATECWAHVSTITRSS